MRRALTGALTVFLMGIAFGLQGRAGAETTKTPAAKVPVAVLAPSCPATLVRYGVSAESPRETAPWIAAGPGRTRIAGFLYAYTGSRMLADARVSRAPGLVLYAGRLAKIGWIPRSWGDGWGQYLTIEGRRLDGSGRFHWRFRRSVAPQFYPTGVTLPSVGCWRLTLRSGTRTVSVTVQSIEPPAELPCDLSKVGPSGISATPTSSGIVAGWHWQTDDGGALMYVGGKTPEGGNTKVLWRIERGYTQTVKLLGGRLDGSGSFEHTATAVNPPGYYPSTVVVPTPGCWLLTIRTGSLGGIIVFRAVTP